MTERVLPGVSIKEVTEGLISPALAGAVAVKLVGTACKGSTDAQYFGPDELSKLKDEYGPLDPYHYNESTTTNPPMELNLVRAARLLYKAAPPGGVWVCRAQASSVKAVGAAMTATNLTVTFTAKEEGAWYNNFQYNMQIEEDAEGNTYTAYAGYRPSTMKMRVPSYELFDSTLDTSNFATSDNQFFVNTNGITFEFYASSTDTTPTVSDFVAQWDDASNPLNAYFDMSVGASTGTEFAVQTAFASIYTASDTAGTNWGATDTAPPTSAMYSAALEKIRGKEARFTVIAGASENTTDYSGVIAVGQSHVGNASNENLEQIYYCGVANNTSQDSMVTTVLTVSPLNIADDRVVIVAPGVETSNEFYGATGTFVPSDVSTDTSVILSGGYAACLAAGLSAQQVPDESPMNKPLSGIVGLEHSFTRSNQKQLVRGSFFLLVDDNGYRTLRDLTSAGSTDPFFHISTRAVIDDIKRSIRSTGNPFIGRKNIPRNRAKLQSNLEYVLEEYQRREIITEDWSIQVTSSRTEQIIGVVRVVMIIQTVFYMEFIEVDMVLE